MVIERGADNTLVVMGRVTLSPSYWLLHFTDIERGGNAYCVVQAGNSSASFISLTFTETTSPVALDGEVLLSPPGNWNVKIYEQTSSTNLSPSLANRLVKDVDIYVDGDGVPDSGWTETCPDSGGGGDCDPLFYTIENTDGTALLTGMEMDPCGKTLTLTAPDATITFDGLALGTAPSGATTNFDCGTLLDAAYVENGGSVTGTYFVTGTLNGREVYTLDNDHNLEYTGTRWRLVKPGQDIDAAAGSEQFPWDADWSATSVTVQQATIGAYCGGDEVPCADLTVEVNGEVYGTVANPCGATAVVDVENTDGTDVGGIVGGKWVVADTTARLFDTNGNSFQFQDIPAGTTGDITVPDSSVEINGTAFTTIPAAGTGNIDVVRSADLQPVGAAGGGQWRIGSTDVQLRDSAANNIGSVLSILPEDTQQVITAPDATVRTTDGGTTVQAIRSNASGNLPQSVIKYRDASNVAQVTAASNTEFASSTLRPATEIPRRELKDANGLGLGIFVSADQLIADTLPAITQTMNASLADNTFSGTTTVLTAGENLVIGDVCRVGSDGKAYKAIATAIATSSSLFIATASITINTTGVFGVTGYLRMDAISALTVGDLIYLSKAAAGGYTQTMPASATDEVSQVIGVALAAKIIYFKPELVQVVHA
jgi:hypothetical protein